MAADCLEARARAPWTRQAEPVSIAFALGLCRGLKLALFWCRAAWIGLVFLSMALRLSRWAAVLLELPRRRRPGIPVRSEMSQPDSDGLDLSYRITPEYMSRCSQIHTATRLTKLTSISTYYCSIYCCFCFPIPKSSLQVIQTMAPSGYITAKISVKM